LGRMRRNTTQTDATDEPDLDEHATSQRLPIYVAFAGAHKGMGAFASRNLTAGQFIGEYSGEILCEDELEGTVSRPHLPHLLSAHLHA
jgi:hypothetical protein